MTDTGSRRSSMGLMGSPRRVLLNDDEAEKRNRRRSRADRRRSHLVTPKHQFVIGRSSLGGESITGSTIGTPSVQSLTPEELNRQYEEWMKIAADNVGESSSFLLSINICILIDFRKLIQATLGILHSLIIFII
jgi:hypothetical protein